ncbi:MAG: hypothetical protein FWH51_03525 [Dehalococcoidia bacterium]|nr:hypothetical protein [Dehalococcoidia bacterium]
MSMKHPGIWQQYIWRRTFSMQAIGDNAVSALVNLALLRPSATQAVERLAANNHVEKCGTTLGS